MQGRKTEPFPPGFEPGTFRVLGERDNHYTTETTTQVFAVSLLIGRKSLPWS